MYDVIITDTTDNYFGEKYISSLYTYNKRYWYIFNTCYFYLDEFGFSKPPIEHLRERIKYHQNIAIIIDDEDYILEKIAIVKIPKLKFSLNIIRDHPEN